MVRALVALSVQRWGNGARRPGGPPPTWQATLVRQRSERRALATGAGADQLGGTGFRAGVGTACGEAGDLGDLGGGVAQAGADLVDVDLHDGALLALAGLEAALLELAGDDHPGAL